MDNRPVLFFDGDCSLCNGSVRFILRHERAPELLFASLQSEVARVKLKGIELPDSLVLLQGESILLKSDAVLRVCSMLKGWPSWFAKFYFVPKPLRDMVYDLIARMRKPLFGTTMHCAITHSVDRTRFIDL